MNYLAHAYLSFGNKEILLGNMINDFVKGKQQYAYPAPVQKGLQLHRLIDAFTDTHAATKQARQYFQPAYRLYSGAFIDIVYDYFLANDTNEFAGENELFRFSQNTYQMLDTQQTLMPPRFAHLYHYMKAQNWLYGYRTGAGIAQSFGGLVRRAAYMHDASPAIRIFENNLEPLQAAYRLFWKDLKLYTLNQLKNY